MLSQPNLFVSPFVGDAGPLDVRQQAVLRDVARREHESIVALPTDHPLDPKRRARDEATYPELVAQPLRVRESLDANDDDLAELASAIVALAPDRVFVVGAGDSLAAAVAARPILEAMLRVPCEPVQSLEFAYYLAPLVTPRTVVIAISSSGETTRTVEAALVAQQRGAVTVAITNSRGSTLDVECRTTLLLCATRVGWPTQSTTTALALLQSLGLRVGTLSSHPDAEALSAEFAQLPDLMEAGIGSSEGPLAATAEAEHASGTFLFCGGGPSWGVAVMGAAKVKECTPNRAEAIQVEEFHHYNSLKAGEPLWVVAPSGLSVPRAVHTCAEAKRFGGRVHVVTSEGERSFDDVADSLVTTARVEEPLSPLLTIVPVQLVAYLLAMAQFRHAEAAQIDGELHG